MAAKPDPKPSQRPAFNPSTRRSHRGEMFGQILLPLIAGVLVCGLLFYLVLVGGAGSIERSAQIAIIFLAIPMLLAGLALLGLILVLTSGIGKLMSWLPEPAVVIQNVAESINRGAQKTARAVTRPFITVDAWGTALRRVFKRKR